MAPIAGECGTGDSPFAALLLETVVDAAPALEINHDNSGISRPVHHDEIDIGPDLGPGDIVNDHTGRLDNPSADALVCVA
jgi:hypothetical protein